MQRYMVIVEQGTDSFGAYVPDLPGCVAVGESRDEVLALIREAIEFHLEQYLSGDMNGSEISDIWLRPSDGLLMRWTSVIEAKGKTVFGQTHFHEEDSITLTDVAPRQ